MEIRITREASFLLKGKNVSFAVLRPGILKVEKIEGIDALIFPQKQNLPKSVTQVLISGPGEYEVKGGQVIGVAQEGVINYKVKIDGVRIALVFNKIREKEEEFFSDIDVLIPDLVNDGQNLSGLVLKLEPKIVAIWGVDPTRFLKALGREEVKPQTKITVNKEKLPSELEVVWLKV